MEPAILNAPALAPHSAVQADDHLLGVLPVPVDDDAL
jgi:hypothetical protein